LRDSVSLRRRNNGRSAFAQRIEIALQVALADSPADSGPGHATKIDALFRRDFQHDGGKAPRTVGSGFSFMKSRARRLHGLRRGRGLARSRGFHLNRLRLRRGFRRDDFQFCRSLGAGLLDDGERRADRQRLSFGRDNLRDSARARRRNLGVNLVG